MAARARRLEERLIAAGLTSDDEIDEFLTRLYTNASPVNGARMVARAWTDPRYRDLLLSDGDAAAKEMGFGDLSYALRIVPNTETTHNVIVCTLCSCYPVSLLGPSPGAGYRPPGVMPSSLPRAYLVAGTLEPFFHENATRWAEALRDAGADVVMTERVGSHGDAFWREEFPLMVAWAFGR